MEPSAQQLLVGSAAHAALGPANVIPEPQQSPEAECSQAPVLRRRKTRTEQAQSRALFLLRWRSKIMGIDAAMPWWARLFGLCLFLFSFSGIFIFGVKVIGSVAHLDGGVHSVDWMHVIAAISSFGSVSCWIFCWRVHAHIALEGPSEKVRARILLNEVVLFMASLMVVAGLMLARDDGSGNLLIFLIVAVVVTLPYHVFVELLQVQCIVYEEAIYRHLALVNQQHLTVNNLRLTVCSTSSTDSQQSAHLSLRALREQLKKGAVLFSAGIVTNTMVSVIILVTGIIMVLYGSETDKKVVTNLSLGLFYTVVLTAQLLPLAMLNYTGLNATRAPLLELDDAVCSAVGHIESDVLLCRMVQLNAMQANPPVLDVCKITITPYVLVRTCFSIVASNFAALVYTYLRHSVR